MGDAALESIEKGTPQRSRVASAVSYDTDVHLRSVA